MSRKYEDYRKKIEDIFQSDLEKTDSIIMRKILFIISDQDHLEKTIDIASIFCDKTNTHIKFINGPKFYSSRLSNQKLLSTSEIISQIERSTIENGEVSIIREGKPFEGINDIVMASNINFIIVQFPFSTILSQETPNDSSLGQTIDLLLNDAFTSRRNLFLILKNSDLGSDGFNHVLMLGTDWINSYSFRTVVNLSNHINAKLSLLPFIEESLYDEKDLERQLEDVDKEISSFIGEANSWLVKNNYKLNIHTESLTHNKNEILTKIHELQPELVAFYVPRKPEIIDIFKDIISDINTNVIIIPEHK